MTEEVWEEGSLALAFALSLAFALACLLAGSLARLIFSLAVSLCLQLLSCPLVLFPSVSRYTAHPHVTRTPLNLSPSPLALFALGSRLIAHKPVSCGAGHSGCTLAMGRGHA